ncbi:MAG: DNA-directed RNA polymerase subunit omega [Deltaproteobacteria bacterium]|nr:MAG: DNA-directed RNA polymerase subunit omega [Deltaproteobacteria bacterium]
MARVTIEDCMKKVSNRFMLVHLGAKRVIQLRKGSKPLVDAPKNKEIVLALREIAAGEVDFDSVTLIEQDQLAKGTPEESPGASEESTPSEEVKEEAPAAEGEVKGGEKTKKTADAVDQG